MSVTKTDRNGVSLGDAPDATTSGFAPQPGQQAPEGDFALTVSAQDEARALLNPPLASTTQFRRLSESSGIYAVGVEGERHLPAGVILRTDAVQISKAKLAARLRAEHLADVVFKGGGYTITVPFEYDTTRNTFLPHTPYFGTNNMSSSAPLLVDPPLSGVLNIVQDDNHIGLSLEEKMPQATSPAHVHVGYQRGDVYVFRTNALKLSFTISGQPDVAKIRDAMRKLELKKEDSDIARRQIAQYWQGPANTRFPTVHAFEVTAADNPGILRSAALGMRYPDGAEIAFETYFMADQHWCFPISDNPNAANMVGVYFRNGPAEEWTHLELAVELKKFGDYQTLAIKGHPGTWALNQTNGTVWPTAVDFSTWREVTKPKRDRKAARTEADIIKNLDREQSQRVAPESLTWVADAERAKASVAVATQPGADVSVPASAASAVAVGGVTPVAPTSDLTFPAALDLYAEPKDWALAALQGQMNPDVPVRVRMSSGDYSVTLFVVFGAGSKTVHYQFNTPNVTITTPNGVIRDAQIVRGAPEFPKIVDANGRVLFSVAIVPANMTSAEMIESANKASGYMFVVTSTPWQDTTQLFVRMAPTAQTYFQDGVNSLLGLGSMPGKEPQLLPQQQLNNLTRTPAGQKDFWQGIDYGVGQMYFALQKNGRFFAFATRQSGQQTYVQVGLVRQGQVTRTEYECRVTRQGRYALVKIEILGRDFLLDTKTGNVLTISKYHVPNTATIEEKGSGLFQTLARVPAGNSWTPEAAATAWNDVSVGNSDGPAEPDRPAAPDGASAVAAIAGSTPTERAVPSPVAAQPHAAIEPTQVRPLLAPNEILEPDRENFLVASWRARLHPGESFSYQMSNADHTVTFVAELWFDAANNAFEFSTAVGTAYFLTPDGTSYPVRIQPTAVRQIFTVRDPWAANVEYGLVFRAGASKGVPILFSQGSTLSAEEKSSRALETLALQVDHTQNVFRRGNRQSPLDVLLVGTAPANPTVGQVWVRWLRLTDNLDMGFSLVYRGAAQGWGFQVDRSTRALQVAMQTREFSDAGPLPCKVLVDASGIMVIEFPFLRTRYVLDTKTGDIVPTDTSQNIKSNPSKAASDFKGVIRGRRIVVVPPLQEAAVPAMVPTAVVPPASGVVDPSPTTTGLSGASGLFSLILPPADEDAEPVRGSTAIPPAETHALTQLPAPALMIVDTAIYQRRFFLASLSEGLEVSVPFTADGVTLRIPLVAEWFGNQYTFTAPRGVIDLTDSTSHYPPLQMSRISNNNPLLRNMVVFAEAVLSEPGHVRLHMGILSQHHGMLQLSASHITEQEFAEIVATPTRDNLRPYIQSHKEEARRLNQEVRDYWLGAANTIFTVSRHDDWVGYVNPVDGSVLELHVLGTEGNYRLDLRKGRHENVTKPRPEPLAVNCRFREADTIDFLTAHRQIITIGPTLNNFDIIEFPETGLRVAFDRRDGSAWPTRVELQTTLGKVRDRASADIASDLAKEKVQRLRQANPIVELVTNSNAGEPPAPGVPLTAASPVVAVEEVGGVAATEMIVLGDGSTMPAAVAWIRLDDLDLSVRAENVFANQGIEYLWQFLQYSEAQLLAFKNFGRKSLREMQEIMEVIGRHNGDLTLHLETVFPPSVTEKWDQARTEEEQRQSLAAISAANVLSGRALMRRSIIRLSRDIAYYRIDALDLSVRSANGLQNSGIEYLWQLLEKTDEELLKTRNFGRRSLYEIKEIVSEFGAERDLVLRLGMKVTIIDDGDVIDDGARSDDEPVLDVDTSDAGVADVDDSDDAIADDGDAHDGVTDDAVHADELSDTRPQLPAALAALTPPELVPVQAAAPGFPNPASAAQNPIPWNQLFWTRPQDMERALITASVTGQSSDVVFQGGTTASHVELSAPLAWDRARDVYTPLHLGVRVDGAERYTNTLTAIPVGTYVDPATNIDYSTFIYSATDAATGAIFPAMAMPTGVILFTQPALESNDNYFGEILTAWQRYTNDFYLARQDLFRDAREDDNAYVLGDLLSLVATSHNPEEEPFEELFVQYAGDARIGLTVIYDEASERWQFVDRSTTRDGFWGTDGVLIEGSYRARADGATVTANWPMQEFGQIGDWQLLYWPMYHVVYALHTRDKRIMVLPEKPFPDMGGWNDAARLGREYARRLQVLAPRGPADADTPPPPLAPDPTPVDGTAELTLGEELTQIVDGDRATENITLSQGGSGQDLITLKPSTSFNFDVAVGEASFGFELARRPVDGRWYAQAGRTHGAQENKVIRRIHVPGRAISSTNFDMHTVHFGEFDVVSFSHTDFVIVLHRASGLFITTTNTMVARTSAQEIFTSRAIEVNGRIVKAAGQMPLQGLDVAREFGLLVETHPEETAPLSGNAITRVTKARELGGLEFTFMGRDVQGRYVYGAGDAIDGGLGRQIQLHVPGDLSGLNSSMRECAIYLNGRPYSMGIDVFDGRVLRVRLYTRGAQRDTRTQIQGLVLYFDPTTNSFVNVSKPEEFENWMTSELQLPILSNVRARTSYVGEGTLQSALFAHNMSPAQYQARLRDLRRLGYRYVALSDFAQSRRRGYQYRSWASEEDSRPPTVSVRLSTHLLPLDGTMPAEAILRDDAERVVSGDVAIPAVAADWPITPLSPQVANAENQFWLRISNTDQNLFAEQRDMQHRVLHFEMGHRLADGTAAMQIFVGEALRVPARNQASVEYRARLIAYGQEYDLLAVAQDGIVTFALPQPNDNVTFVYDAESSTFTARSRFPGDPEMLSRHRREEEQQNTLQTYRQGLWLTQQGFFPSFWDWHQRNEYEIGFRPLSPPGPNDLPDAEWIRVKDFLRQNFTQLCQDAMARDETTVAFPFRVGNTVEWRELSIAASDAAAMAERAQPLAPAAAAPLSLDPVAPRVEPLPVPPAAPVVPAASQIPDGFRDAFQTALRKPGRDTSISIRDGYAVRGGSTQRATEFTLALPIVLDATTSRWTVQNVAGQAALQKCVIGEQVYGNVHTNFTISETVAGERTLLLITYPELGVRYVLDCVTGLGYFSLRLDLSANGTPSLLEEFAQQTIRVEGRTVQNQQRALSRNFTLQNYTSVIQQQEVIGTAVRAAWDGSAQRRYEISYDATTGRLTMGLNGAFAYAIGLNWEHFMSVLGSMGLAHIWFRNAAGAQQRVASAVEFHSQTYGSEVFVIYTLRGCDVRVVINQRTGLAILTPREIGQRNLESLIQSFISAEIVMNGRVVKAAGAMPPVGFTVERPVLPLPNRLDAARTLVAENQSPTRAMEFSIEDPGAGARRTIELDVGFEVSGGNTVMIVRDVTPMDDTVDVENPKVFRYVVRSNGVISVWHNNQQFDYQIDFSPETRTITHVWVSATAMNSSGRVDSRRVVVSGPAVATVVMPRGGSPHPEEDSDMGEDDADWSAADHVQLGDRVWDAVVPVSDADIGIASHVAVDLHDMGDDTEEVVVVRVGVGDWLEQERLARQTHRGVLLLHDIDYLDVTAAELEHVAETQRHNLALARGVAPTAVVFRRGDKLAEHSDTLALAANLVMLPDEQMRRLYLSVAGVQMDTDLVNEVLQSHNSTLYMQMLRLGIVVPHADLGVWLLDMLQRDPDAVGEMEHRLQTEGVDLVADPETLIYELLIREVAQKTQSRLLVDTTVRADFAAELHTVQMREGVLLPQGTAAFRLELAAREEAKRVEEAARRERVSEMLRRK